MFLVPAVSSSPLLKFSFPTASAPPQPLSTGSLEDLGTTQEQERKAARGENN